MWWYVNLIDEAQRKGIHVDVPCWRKVRVPALATAARDAGLPELLDAIYAVATGEVNPTRLVNYPDEIAAAIDRVAARIGHAAGWCQRPLGSAGVAGG